MGLWAPPSKAIRFIYGRAGWRRQVEPRTGRGGRHGDRPAIARHRAGRRSASRLVLEWLPSDTTYGQRRYKAADGQEIAVSAILMGADRTSIHKPKYCLNGSGWRIEKEQSDTVAILRPHAYQLPVTCLRLVRDAQLPSGQTVQVHGCYVYWFVADRELTADHNERMWWMARDLMRTGVLQRWAYLACLAVCPPGKDEETYRRVKDFIADAVPQFQLTHGPETHLARSE